METSVNREGEIYERAKETVRNFYTKAAEILDDERRAKLIKHAQASESLNKIKAMVILSQSSIPVLPETLDTDTWLLNINNGTLDLRTNKLKPHRKEDFITKLININYIPEAQCPTWEKFLNRIFESNKKLIRFIQKAIGYSLTASTQEQCIFILHGTGANGKSTFLTTINNILSDYAQKTPSETLMMKKYTGAVPNDLAMLRGARFVSSVETEEGRALAEVLIKQLSGDDIICARFLFSEFFQFKPVCKIWLASNHKPRIRGTDYAIWRRIKLIPFNITIPEAERDKTLPEKLNQEKEGILRWAVTGCQLWQKEGFETPEEVKKATEAYRAEMDVIGGFIADCCVIGDKYNANAKDLYEAYVKWCEENGENAISQRIFGLKLTERGIIKQRITGGFMKGKICYITIGLLKKSNDNNG